MTDATLHVTNRTPTLMECLGAALLALPRSPRQGADVVGLEGGRSWCKISTPSRAELTTIQGGKQ